MFRQSSPLTIFTPSFADEDNTNAQNLTVKEIVARLPPELFRVIMLCAGDPDPRIATRRNTKLLHYHRHGNAAHLLAHSWFSRPDIYFYPRTGPLDRAWFALKKRLAGRTRLVTHVVSSMNSVDEKDLLVQSILQADAVFANSAFVAQTVRQRFARDAGTIYNGIDRRFFFPGSGREEKRQLRVLYAGSFRSHKRPDFVIRQAARFSEVSFHLAGQGEREADCRRLVSEFGCRNVTFLGHLSQRQLGDAMRGSDIFLFPSLEEGHPQVLGQAAACGLPAIAMNSYRPDYVVNDETGFLPNSDQDIATKLDLLICNSGLRAAMSATAIRHSQKFDWDRISGQWAEVLMQVTGRSMN
jgi:glycosyltransferase involved in cell wall biosynthesis